MLVVAKATYLFGWKATLAFIVTESSVFILFFLQESMSSVHLQGKKLRGTLRNRTK